MTNDEGRNPREYRRPNAETADAIWASLDIRASDFFRHFVIRLVRFMVPMRGKNAAKAHQERTFVLVVVLVLVSVGSVSRTTTTTTSTRTNREHCSGQVVGFPTSSGTMTTFSDSGDGCEASRTAAAVCSSGSWCVISRRTSSRRLKTSSATSFCKVKSAE